MKPYDDIEAEDCYDMAVEWLHAGDTEKAISHLRRAVELNPHFVYAYITLAQAHARLKNYDDSLNAVRKAMKADPAFDRLPFLAAKYAYRAGSFAAALDFIDRAIALSPSKLYTKARRIIEAAYRNRRR